MGNVHNFVNNVGASHSVNIELLSISSNAANSTCVFEAIIENPLNLSALSHKVEDLEGTLFSKLISVYCTIDVAVLVSVFSSFLCPECGCSTLSLSERYTQRQGLSSLLYLKCLKKKLKQSSSVIQALTLKQKHLLIF